MMKLKEKRSTLEARLSAAHRVGDWSEGRYAADRLAVEFGLECHPLVQHYCSTQYRVLRPGAKYGVRGAK